MERFEKDPRATLPFTVGAELRERLNNGDAMSAPPESTARAVTVAMLITALVGATGTGLTMLAWSVLGGWAVFPTIFAFAWVFVYIWAKLTD